MTLFLKNIDRAALQRKVLRAVVSGATIFTSAFLLFLVQPLTARRVLPWFGGSPTVWIVALLFFQSTLLAGYLYAHVLTRCLEKGRQGAVHVSLLLVAVAFLPIGPHEPPGVEARDPTFTLLGMLATSLAVPLLLLSSTNPLLQGWLFHSAPEADRPKIYRLFAVSNLGSLLGLWSYPFVFEPWTTVGFQAHLWSGLYVAFVVLSAITAVAAISARKTPTAGVDSGERVGIAVRALWVALPVTGSILLMATSNQLTRNVAAVPFLWVLPLSLYLTSFIVAFERDRWYVRSFWGGLFLLSLLGVLHLLGQREEPPLVLQLVIYSVNLLAGTMICHGELARLRPRTEGITSFYLYVAAGGALGGVAVSLVAPEVFRGYWEYPVALAAVYWVGGAAMWRRHGRGAEMEEDARPRLVWALGGIVLAGLLVAYVNWERSGVTVMTRSFFGVLRVYDHDAGTDRWTRYLWNGPIAHGGQLMAPERRREPVLYYGPETGVALALGYQGPPWEVRGRHIGVIGLGTGSLTLQARPQDRMRFYEVNPDVVDVAREYFHYLDEAKAEVEVVVGDGRLALTRELAGNGSQGFDVLVIDAFTGDAIPIHLLTREAFRVYERHLSPDGILAVHISNLHFDLRPVVRAQAEALDSVPVLVESDSDQARNLYATDWVLITRNAAFLADPELQIHWRPWRGEVEPGEHLWTDDYANLFGVLK